MQILLWHTPSRQNPLGIVAIEERTGGPLHLPDGEPLLYASLVAVGPMRPQVDALAEHRGKQQNDPCREAVVCGSGEEVCVVAPKQADGSVLPIYGAKAYIMEIALEVLEARGVELLDGSLLARVAEEEVDAQFLIHEHEDVLAVVDRALVEETDFMLHVDGKIIR